jgi:hypothetical protein
VDLAQEYTHGDTLVDPILHLGFAQPIVLAGTLTFHVPRLLFVADHDDRILLTACCTSAFPFLRSVLNPIMNRVELPLVVMVISVMPVAFWAISDRRKPQAFVPAVGEERATPVRLLIASFCFMTPLVLILLMLVLVQ